MDYTQNILMPTVVGLSEHGLTLGLRTIIDHKQYNTSYTSINTIVKDIYTKKGSLGFFKGCVPLLTSVGASHSALFYCLQKSREQNVSEKTQMLWGAAGKFLHDAMIVPGDTIRQRCNLLNLTVAQSIKNIYQTRGTIGFFYGLLPSLMISIPSGSIEFYTVNKFSSLYGSNGMFLYGAIAGIVSSLITSPIDIIKTKYQVDGNLKNLRFKCSLRSLFRGGLLRSFSTRLTYGLFELLQIEHD